ncbi:MAG: FAD-dependent oxidoreductase [Victivallales bacterium]|nr:FAD-dependent oxidoreductase [Victivallales bacterium]
MARMLTEESRQIPVCADVDVVVCGGGPAGVAAALAAARNGASVILLEGQLCLGGQSTSGMMNRLGPYHDQEAMILGGIPWEVLEHLVRRDAAHLPTPCPHDDPDRYWVPFDPEALKAILDDMVEEARIDVLLQTLVVDVVKQAGELRGVIIENKSGRQAVLARCVVDGTGDADVAARAGVPCRKGREADGLMQPMGLLSKVHNLDPARAKAHTIAHHAELMDAAQRLRAAGGIPPERFHCGTDNLLREDETYFNASHAHGMDGTNARHITEVAIRARREIWRNLQFMKDRVPGWEHAYLGATASLLGVRETRCIQGEYTLTLDDVLEGRDFDDGICRYACWVDTHGVVPGEKPEHEGRPLQPGVSYAIPYRSLVPKLVDNLLVAGRCFSGTHEARASARMIPACMAMGQAAGTAAALSVREGLTPRELSTALLRDLLGRQGGIL